MKQILRISVIVLPSMAIAAIAILALARPPSDPGAGGRPQTFEVSGSVAPVYPLVDAVLPVEVENPNGFELVVTELTIVASDASAECTADNLMITPVSVPFTVPRKGVKTVETEVRLVDDVADACQDATFPLTYRGTATRP